MWFKKKKEETNETVHKKDEAMSRLIDEVLNEQAQAKEAAMRENAEPITPQNAPFAQAPKSSLADLIVKFRENQNQETFQTVLNALVPSNLLITMTPVEGSENKEEKTMQFSPALVKDPNGEKLLPAFSDKGQIPTEHEGKFSIVTMPFGAACELVQKLPECEKIIVNPFTDPFVVNKDIIENIAKAVAAQREKNNTMVEFSLPEEGTETVAKKVAEYFKGVSEIKAAYFTKMKQQGKVSYAFIIDCPDENVTFPKVIEFLKAEKIALPISLLPYNKLEKVVNESKQIKKVY